MSEGISQIVQIQNSEGGHPTFNQIQNSAKGCPVVNQTERFEGGCPVVNKVEKNDGSCPVINRKSATEEKVATADQVFMAHTNDSIKKIFDGLRKQTLTIEQSIETGEQDVLAKDDTAFTMRANELALSNMANAHAVDYQKLKKGLAAILEARAERKKAKQEARKSIRASKKRDQIIQQQEKSAQAAARIRETISEKRTAFDALTNHMNEIHEKQRKNMMQAQERQYTTEKLLCDLETRHLKEELRSTIMKKFQVRQNHQGHLNKRINENLRERQLMELRHSKERSELEVTSYEEIASIKVLHEIQLTDLRLKQMNELHAEKENVVQKHESEKEELLKRQHKRQLRELANEQKISLRQLRIKLSEKVAASRGSASSSKSASQIGSNASSARHSRAGSSDSIALDSPNKKGSMKITEDAEEDDIDNGDVEKSKNAAASLKMLIIRHKEEYETLTATIQRELNDHTLAFDAKQADMLEAHEREISDLLEEQERQLGELKQIQEKEIMMEESMHDSEMKMLIERRILNSVLETVADGIINITPVGVIKRFNHAAELMFGYKSSEVIGNNITMLMPERFGKNHHEYLNSYLTTGVKKVIGIGRRVFGLKKDGSEFPLHLSISELKEDGEHLFTGIARDLTREVAEENRVQQMQKEKNMELEQYMKELDIAKKKADGLISQILPAEIAEALMNGKEVAPRSFECATIFFLDIVGFTTISAQIKPLEVVSFLNALYHDIDGVIEQYDVYKVETIGDSYMIVSGLPKIIKNHASEIATMALHLMYVIDQFTFAKNPDLKIRVRMGMNSGPVVAGVVGSKMPRYCLFGDTVNTTSRMESTGQPGKIQLSESCYKLLKAGNQFEMINRGEVEVKGKGKMNTFWLEGKTGFDPSKLQKVLPELPK